MHPVDALTHGNDVAFILKADRPSIRDLVPNDHPIRSKTFFKLSEKIVNGSRTIVGGPCYRVEKNSQRK